METGIGNDSRAAVRFIKYRIKWQKVGRNESTLYVIMIV